MKKKNWTKFLIEDTQWFIKESKKYIGYGKNYSKLRFWTRFPKAYIHFMYLEIRNKRKFDKWLKKYD